MFVSIENGFWMVYDNLDACTRLHLADLQGLRAYFRSTGTTEVMCSSTVDYFEEGRSALAWALSWDIPEGQELN